VRGPLLRAKLLRLAEDDHVLMLTCTTSSQMVGRSECFRELITLQAFMAGGGSPWRICRSSMPTMRFGSVTG
jgi:hypothetical protein